MTNRLPKRILSMFLVLIMTFTISVNSYTEAKAAWALIPEVVVGVGDIVVTILGICGITVTVANADEIADWGEEMADSLYDFACEKSSEAGEAIQNFFNNSKNNGKIKITALASVWTIIVEWVKSIQDTLTPADYSGTTASKSNAVDMTNGVNIFKDACPYFQFASSVVMSDSWCVTAQPIDSFKSLVGNNWLVQSYLETSSTSKSISVVGNDSANITSYPGYTIKYSSSYRTGGSFSSFTIYGGLFSTVGSSTYTLDASSQTYSLTNSSWYIIGGASAVKQNQTSISLGTGGINLFNNLVLNPLVNWSIYLNNQNDITYLFGVETWLKVSSQTTKGMWMVWDAATKTWSLMMNDGKTAISDYTDPTTTLTGDEDAKTCGLTNPVDVPLGNVSVLGNDVKVDDDGNVVDGGYIDVLNPDSVADKSWQDILDAIGATVVDNTVTGATTTSSTVISEDDTNDKPIADTIPITNVGGVNDFALSGLEKIFPFCLPFDLIDFINCLVAEPEAPKFTWDFDLGRFGSYDIDIDLSCFNSVAELLRMMETLAFIFGLIMITRSHMIRS